MGREGMRSVEFRRQLGAGLPVLERGVVPVVAPRDGGREVVVVDASFAGGVAFVAMVGRCERVARVVCGSNSEAELLAVLFAFSVVAEWPRGRVRFWSDSMDVWHGRGTPVMRGLSARIRACLAHRRQWQVRNVSRAQVQPAHVLARRAREWPDVEVFCKEMAP